MEDRFASHMPSIYTEGTCRSQTGPPPFEKKEVASLSLVLNKMTLGSIPIRRFCVQKNCSRPRPRATTPAEDRFLALSARRRRTTTVPQLVADHFQASGRRISATTVRNRLHNAGLYARRPFVCVPLNGRQ
ncbi:HTH_Tnp_Tc3_2 domain-containing protein [Trichonephila clavipes]|nr:HTH_Tnp_Tc3_2 domain-containing protein [Trichonephila clavipes]